MSGGGSEGAASDAPTEYFQTFMLSLRSDIRAILREQKNQSGKLDARSHQLEAHSDKLDEHSDNLRVLVSQMHPLIDSVAALTEDLLRIKAARLFGDSF